MIRHAFMIMITFVSLSASAGGGGIAGGGATLMEQIVQTAEMVTQTTETITQTATQISQLANLQKMLQTAPAAVLAQLGLPDVSKSEAMKILQSVMKAKTAITNANQSLGKFQTAFESVERSAALDHKEIIPYLKSRVDYSVKYNQKLDGDIQMGQEAINNYQRAVEDYNAVADQIPSMTGTTDNLQALNSSMAKSNIQLGQAGALLGKLVELSAAQAKQTNSNEGARTADTVRERQNNQWFLKNRAKGTYSDRVFDIIK